MISSCDQGSPPAEPEGESVRPSPRPTPREVWYDGPAVGQLFSVSDHVLVDNAGATIERSVPVRRRENDVFLLAAPRGEYTPSFEELVLRDTISAEERDLIAEGNDTAIESALRMVKVESFGQFRGVHIMRVAVDYTRSVRVANENYDFARYKLRVDWPAIDAGQPIKLEKALQPGSLYRELLDHLLLVPDVIDRVAQPVEESPLPGPAEWQARPEASPGFPWIKFTVEEERLLRIDADWIEAAGADPAAISPSDLKLMSDGEPVPVVVAGAGKSFAEGASLLFLGLPSQSEETRERAYFVGKLLENEDQRQFVDGPRTMADAEPIQVVEKFARLEKDESRQTEYGAFLSIQSIAWVWQEIHLGDPLDTTFDLPGLATDTDATTLPLTVAIHQTTSTPGKKSFLHLETSEGVQEQTLKAGVNIYQFDVDADSLRETENPVKVWASLEREIPIYADYIEVVYPGTLLLDVEPVDFTFRNDPLGSAQVARVFLRTENQEQLHALDITDRSDPRKLYTEATAGGMLIDMFTGAGRNLLVYPESDITPAPKGKIVEWVDWSDTARSADMLLISHANFIPAAERLAENLNTSGYTALVVDVASIYNGFSHGELSTDAIRRFIALAVHEWDLKPQSAILMGDSSSDPRDRSRDDVPNFMPIPLTTLMKGRDDKTFSTDTLYTMLTGDDFGPDILLGRLSCATLDDAMAWVSNVEKYRAAQDEKVEWGNRLVSVMDTGGFEEALIDVADKELSPAYQNTILSADEVPWEDNYYLPAHLISREQDSKVSPFLTGLIENAFNEGAAVVTFFGHGAPNLWSNQRFWFGGGTPNSDIIRLQNGGRLPLVTSFTCNNAVVDYPLRPWNICIAEDFMRHEDKGAIGCFMPSGPGYLTDHKILAEGFLKAWSKLGVRSQGVLSELTRLYQRGIEPNENHSRMFLFLGDPTLLLPLPADSDAEYLHADVEEVQLGGGVLIEEVNSHNVGDASSPDRAWTLVIGNSLPTEQSVTLGARLYTADGALLKEEKRAISLGPREKQFETIAYTLDQPGGYKAMFDLEHVSAAYDNNRPPTRSIDEFFVVAGRAGSLDIARDSIRLAKGTGGSSAPNLEFVIYNTGTDLSEVTIDGEVETAAGGTQTFSRKMSGIMSGKSILFRHQLPVGIEVKAPINIRLTCTTSGEVGEQPRPIRWDVGPSALADLRVVEDSIQVTPDTLSDGLTVFVTAELINDGTIPSEKVNVALFHEDESNPREALRDMTANNLRELKPLNPGEKRRVRLRWDPADNAGEYRIKILVDPENLLPEPNKTDNFAYIPLNVREKMKLVPGELRVQPRPAPGEALLVADIANTGGTDARRVTVNFYTSEEQTEENKIGEVLVDRIPAKGRAEVPFLWKVESEEDVPADLHLTFTVALKGSLMRTSSVANQEDEPDAGNEESTSP